MDAYKKPGTGLQYGYQANYIRMTYLKTLTHYSQEAIKPLEMLTWYKLNIMIKWQEATRTYIWRGEYVPGDERDHILAYASCITDAAIAFKLALSDPERALRKQDATYLETAMEFHTKYPEVINDIIPIFDELVANKTATALIQ